MAQPADDEQSVAGLDIFLYIDIAVGCDPADILVVDGIPEQFVPGRDVVVEA